MLEGVYLKESASFAATLDNCFDYQVDYYQLQAVHSQIILLMSLLTSPETTKQQHRFFNKMEQEFNKRSFLNQNYTETPHPFEKANQNTQKAQEQLTELMDQFLKSLRKIYQKANDHRIDYYNILSEMKSYDFFNEVVKIFNHDILQKITKIERQNTKLKESLQNIHRQFRESSRVKPARQHNVAKAKFDGIKTIAQNLYEKAKILTGAQFIDLCNKVILQEKVVIKKVAEADAYTKWEQPKNQKVQERDMLKRVDSFLRNKSQTSQGDSEIELSKLILDFKKYNEQREAGFACQRPCCNPVQQKIERTSKATVLRRSSDSRRSSWVYKNDRSEQYFNRYYRKSQFDMHKILNVERTKLEEMEKIEDDYRIAIKQRHKFNRSLIK